ncbi:MAG TPA: ferredoxin [Cryptosporangiaceae bacterium]|nr:ferredoxin [Cryptosporangiaceae bacterium]
MSTVDGSAVAVTVDDGRCVGSATCTVVAADNFVLNEYDQAEPTAAVTSDVEAVERAEQLCPTGAIRIVPVGTGGPG